MRTAVIALGDLGRSARMQYHAHVLVSNGVEVDLVGLEGTPLSRRITHESRIAVHRIKKTRLRIRRSLYGSSCALAGLFNAVRLSFRLWKTLLRLRLGHRHPAVRLARWLERRDARRVEANLCVSRGPTRVST